MKSLYFLMCAVVISATAQAAIINVNNATPSPGEYALVQDAADAAVAGDTIYLAPTNINYGNLDIEKELHIIGPGFGVEGGLLGSYAELEDVTFVGTASSGSSLEGIRIYYPNWGGGSQDYQAFSIKRCIIELYIYTAGAAVNNSIIEGCVFLNTNQNFFASAGWVNCTVRNNIFNGYLQTIDNSNVSNNIFLGVSAGSQVWLQTGNNNNSVSNNMVIGRNTASGDASSTYIGNLSFDGSSDTFPNGTTNLEGVNPEFMTYDAGTYFDFDQDYTLQGTSPGLGSGSGGEDMGVYGGEGVYRKDGEPSIPIIKSVAVPGGNTVPANSTFTINIISEVHE